MVQCIGMKKLTPLFLALLLTLMILAGCGQQSNHIEFSFGLWQNAEVLTYRVERYNVETRDGVEIKEGKLEPGMTFNRVEQTRTTNEGRILYDNDNTILTIIPYIVFN